MSAINAKGMFLSLKTHLPKLNQLYNELFSGGKGVRARLVKDISDCLGLLEKDTDLLCESIESIHHSSILHDDVIDGSKIRRNQVATWVKFSKHEAILAGDYLMARVSFQISNYGNLPLVQLTSQAIQNMVKGELLQKEQKGKETLDALNRVHILKTSSLFEWCLQAPFLISPQNHSSLQILLKEIGTIFGQLFQRADDAMDFGVRNKENKKEFKDVKEGHLNFFGVYLKQYSQLKDGEKLRLCRDIKDVKNLIGEKVLDQGLKEFDQMNEKLISVCNQKISELLKYLGNTKHPICSILREWIPKLYLR